MVGSISSEDGLFGFVLRRASVEPYFRGLSRVSCVELRVVCSGLREHNLGIDEEWSKIMLVDYR